MSLLSGRNNGWDTRHKMYFTPRLNKFPKVRARQFIIIVTTLEGEFEVHLPKDLPLVVPSRVAKVWFE